MNWLRQINSRFGPVGWLMALSASTFLYLLLTLAFSKTTYAFLLENLALPVSFERFLTKPWTLLTYWLAIPAHEIWTLFVSLSIVYGFGSILQEQLGRARFTKMVLIAGLAIPVLTLLIANILPFVERSEATVFFGMFPLSLSVVAACTLLMPNLKMRLLTFEFKMMWAGIVIMALPLIGYRAIFTVMGTGSFSAILIGLGAALIIGRFGKPLQWNTGPKLHDSYAPLKQRVRVKETHSNPQHKGKFTVVHSQARLSREDELNRLLDRINEVGYNGLSASEKRRLEELSGQ